MKVKVLKDSIRFKGKIYYPGETIVGLPDEEIIRLKGMKVIEVLEIDTTEPEYKIQKLTEEVAKLKGENQSLTQEKTTLIEQNKTLTQDKANLTKQNQTLTQENERLKQELEAAKPKKAAKKE